MNNRNVISLFSGAMGLDIGLSRVGMTIVIGQDFDKDCVNTSVANGHNVISGDIRALKASELLERTGFLSSLRLNSVRIPAKLIGTNWYDSTREYKKSEKKGKISFLILLQY